MTKNSPSLRNGKRWTGALLAGVMLSVSTASAQSWKEYRKAGNWTINQYDQSEASGGKPSCSATMFAGPVQALRVERVAEGYLIGFNGLVRRHAEDLIKVTVWFDDDGENRIETDAGFVRDAAYPLDDWASLAHRVSDQPSLTQMLSNKRDLNIAIQNPSDPSKSHVLSFPLQGATQAINELDACFQAALQGGGAAKGAAFNPTGGNANCPDGAARLRHSGLCPSQAYGLLPKGLERGSKTVMGCDWEVNDAAIPGGDFLFYRASKCGPAITELGFSQNGQFAALNVVKVANNPNDNNVWKIGDIFPVRSGDVRDDIRQYASLFMHDKSELNKCAVRGFTADYGYPADALTLDYIPAELAKLPKDEPYVACGELGFASESSAYWKQFGNHLLYLQLGQDAWTDFDPLSLTLVKADQLPRN